MAEMSLPLIVTQTSADPNAARHSALAWFNALLRGGENTDPVSALHQYGLPTAVAWGAYGTWMTHIANAPALSKLARLLLDRRSQRAVGLEAVSELVRDREQRLCCMLTYGTAGNLAELFAEQLYEHLRRYAKDFVQVYRLRMRLPTTTSFDTYQLASEVRRALGLRKREPYGAALARRMPHNLNRRHPLLLLDWGVRGTHAGNRLKLSALEAWLSFCGHQLALECPPNMRLLCCLSLEIAEDNHETLRRRLDQWETTGLFPTPSFRVIMPTPLGHITLQDLREFLTASDLTSCPRELIPFIPNLIWRKTGGRFQKSVELLEQAEQTGWFELYDQLMMEFGPFDSNPVEENDELL